MSKKLSRNLEFENWKYPSPRKISKYMHPVGATAAVERLTFTGSGINNSSIRLNKIVEVSEDENVDDGRQTKAAFPPQKSPTKRISLHNANDENSHCTPKKYKGNDQKGIYASPKLHLSSSASKATNVLRDKSNNINFSRTKSLSTSTPKLCHTNFKSSRRKINEDLRETTPRKRTFLKKFQSFSPVRHVLKQRASELKGEGSKFKKFRTFNEDKLPNRPDEPSSIDSMCPKSPEASLEVIKEELNDSSLDLVERKCLDNSYGSWNDVFSSVNNNGSFNKFDSLINAPIIIDKSSPILDKTNILKRKHTSSTSPELEVSMCDVVLNTQHPVQDLSDQSIENYYQGLRDTFKGPSSSNSSNTNKLDADDDNYASFKQYSSFKRDSLELISHNYAEPKWTTPKKNIVDPTAETNLILHPNLPKTPSKISAKKSRKLQECRRTHKLTRTTYEGIERLNIIGHLEREEPALDKILSYLSGKDLVRAKAVSKSWKKIIENNSPANDRIQEYLQYLIPLKENLDKLKSPKIPPLMKSPKIDEQKRGKIGRFAFKQRNSLTEKSVESTTGSPPRSPSKFNENQKLVKRLKPGAKLTKCIRCMRPCEIISPTMIDEKSTRSTLSPQPAHVKSPRKRLFDTQEQLTSRKQVKKSSSLPIFSDVSRLSIQSPNSKSGRSNSLAILDYPQTSFQSHQQSNFFDRNSSIWPSDTDSVASTGDSMTSSICLRSMASTSSHAIDYAFCKTCDYAFCVNCLSDYHPHSECIEIGEFSPSKEDEKPDVVKRKGKKHLKRLCWN